MTKDKIPPNTMSITTIILVKRGKIVILLCFLSIFEVMIFKVRKLVLNSCPFKPRFCSRLRNEAKKTAVKRVVGAVL